MKKYLLLILIVVFAIGMSTFVSATVFNTPHELAPEPCAMCHTPHSGTGQYPLWNRLQVAPTYETYDSVSFDMGPTFQPRPPSSLCLVCHNGLASSLVNYPGPCSVTDGAYDLQISGCADLDTWLMDDHPISFNYDDTLDTATDGNGFPPATDVSVGTRVRYAIVGGLSGTNYFLYAASGASAPTDRWFECATCHSVHDLATYDGKGDYQVYFLRNDNTRSTMCKDCHTLR
ncbi:MAG: hypothetical protein HXY53_01005 [Nitrospirae bacterium]|nr:hypothetical protein [Nitrospirota bacterium]